MPYLPRPAVLRSCDPVCVVAICCAALYALAGIAAAFGIWRMPRARRLGEDELPRVSVLLSARNEERDLPRCLASLLALDYPHNRLEVLLVDDRSTDGTAQIMAEACAGHPWMRALDTRGYTGPLQAKSRGIAYAAEQATGEWLFITDADGAVPPGWIRAMLGRADAHTGILSAPFVTEATSLVGLFERATVIPALSISFGVGGYGAEVVPMGPNMAIRREVYESQGGLGSVRFRIAEDIALWQLSQRAGLRVTPVMEPEATVRVMPVPSMKHLISQQRRWLVGGFGDGPAHVRWASIGVALYAFVGTLAALVACARGQAGGLVAVGLMGLSQLASMSAMRLRLEVRPVWRMLPVSLVYTMALFLWLPLTAFLLPRVHWRGEGYDIKYRS